jgi:hypothetical protein
MPRQALLRHSYDVSSSSRTMPLGFGQCLRITDGGSRGPLWLNRALRSLAGILTRPSCPARAQGYPTHMISVDGEAIASANFDPKTGVTRWASPEPDSSERAAAALAGLADGLGDELLDAFVPDEAQSGRPCSESAKKWVACIGLGAIATTAGGDIADDYCD